MIGVAEHIGDSGTNVSSRGILAARKIARSCSSLPEWPTSLSVVLVSITLTAPAAVDQEVGYAAAQQPRQLPSQACEQRSTPGAAKLRNNVR